MKDQFSSGCGGVDILGDALEADVSVVQVGDGLDEVVEGSAEAVEPPDDQGVAGFVALTAVGQNPARSAA